MAAAAFKRDIPACRSADGKLPYIHVKSRESDQSISPLSCLPLNRKRRPIGKMGDQIFFGHRLAFVVNIGDVNAGSI